MHFQQYDPPDCLKDYVRYFWTLESDDVGAQPKTFRMIADGCPGLIFQYLNNAPFLDQAHKQWPRLLLYGQTIQPGEIYAPGPFRTLGVYFQPSALAAVFGLKADELTDSCLDLELLANKQSRLLSDQLLNAASTPARLQLLCSFLLAKINANRLRVDPGTQYALAAIRRSGGIIALQQVQRDLQLSERSFQRRFKQVVGVPPKLFARVCQFQASLHQLRRHEYDKLSDIALANEYADQSHCIRGFKEFAGVSPYNYQKQLHELLENFPVVIR